MGTAQGQKPPYARNMEAEIEQLKEDRDNLQRVLNLLFDTNRNWLDITVPEISKLREMIKHGLEDET